MRMRLRRTIPLLAALLVACAGKEGPTGPVGPAGPKGDQGLPGPGQHLMVTAPANGTGGASVALPAAVGTDPTSPPAMSCYLTNNPASGVWISVGDGYSATSPYCGLVFGSGVWHAVMVHVPSGYTAGFAIVY